VPDRRPTIVDIFCGCGGLSEGFSQAGFEVLLGVDCDAWAVRTYDRHHNNRGRIKNVEDIDSNYIFTETGRKDIDVLVGGPPCQAFSHVSVAKWKSLGVPVTLRHPLI
jgi:DNA (cytosine-5)-methyltransferase 1